MGCVGAGELVMCVFCRPWELLMCVWTMHVCCVCERACDVCVHIPCDVCVDHEF